MADLGRAQGVVTRAGNPVLDAALRTLLDPFRSLDALPRLAPPLDAALPDGTPTWWFVLRCGWLLWPGSPPPVKPMLLDAARLSSTEGAFSFARGEADAAAVAAVAAVLCRRSAVSQPVLEARVLASLPRLSEWSAAGNTACHAALVALEGMGSVDGADVLAGQARGRLMEAMAAGALDGAAAVQVLESALLGGTGPGARLPREARRHLGTLQDRESGGWGSAADSRAQAVVTFHALLLLMRGG